MESIAFRLGRNRMSASLALGNSRAGVGVSTNHPQRAFSLERAHGKQLRFDLGLWVTEGGGGCFHQ